MSLILAIIMVVSIGNGLGTINTQAAKKQKLSSAQYAAVFNFRYYYNKYDDLKVAVGNNESALLSHFVNSGMAEGRQGNEEFNVQAYKARYADLRNAYGDNLKLYYLHYINSGKAEGRNARPGAVNSVESSKTTNPTTSQNPTTTLDPAKTPQMQVIDLVNAERAKAGLAPLKYDPSTQNVADERAREQVQRFGHTRPDGSSCWTAYSGPLFFCGENAAYNGSPSAQGVVNQWMNSPGHRANILGNFKYISVGMYKSGSRYYWVQCFFN